MFTPALSHYVEHRDGQDEQILELRDQDKLTDDHLFSVIDLSLPRKDRVEHVVAGNSISRFIRDGHYDIEYLGENPTSRQKLIDRKKERIQEETGRGLTEFKQRLRGDNPISETQPSILPDELPMPDQEEEQEPLQPIDPEHPDEITPGPDENPFGSLNTILETVSRSRKEKK